MSLLEQLHFTFSVIARKSVESSCIEIGDRCLVVFLAPFPNFKSYSMMHSFSVEYLIIAYISEFSC